MFSFFNRRRRRKLLARPRPPTWGPWLAALPFFGELDAGEQIRLARIARVLVAEKRWEGCGGLDMTEKIQVQIAAQAALLILNLDHDYYHRTRSILVYPSTFAVPGHASLDETRATLGLAHEWGTVVLSWNAAHGGAANAEDGHNVVLHEFAHRLDMLDHHTDGTPPLDSPAQVDAWVRIMTHEFQALGDAKERGRRTLLDKYGATEPAEFFAVATECFFEKPRQMLNQHPELYGLLKEYFRQDPAARRRSKRLRE